MQLADRRFHAGTHVEALAAALVGGRPDERVDDIVDEHVVAGIGTVAEDLRRPAGEQCPGEYGDNTGLAVRVLAGAIDIGRCDV